MNLSAYGGLVQYRFGSDGASQIRFPLVPDEWRKSTRAATLKPLDPKKGGGAYLAFLKHPIDMLSLVPLVKAGQRMKE